VALAVLHSQSLAPHPGKALVQRPKVASRFFILIALRQESVPMKNSNTAGINSGTSGLCSSTAGTIGNRQSAIGNRQSAIGNRQSAIGNRQSAIIKICNNNFKKSADYYFSYIKSFRQLARVLLTAAMACAAWGTAPAHAAISITETDTDSLRYATAPGWWINGSAPNPAPK
jgi:hypothetical protein